jgi:16S rRNA processing protein RimM
MSSRSSKSDPPAALPDFITIGRVRKPHGLKGEVTVGVLSDVDERFAAGSVVDLVLADGQRRSTRISAVRGRRDEAIVRFAGLETRDQAEELREAMLEIDRSRVPSAPPGAFYFFELVGCECTDRRAGELGSVARVLDDGGGLLLEIEAGPRSLLVPFVEEYLQEVDIANRRIELQLPEGLIETCTSGS